MSFPVNLGEGIVYLYKILDITYYIEEMMNDVTLSRDAPKARRS